MKIYKIVERKDNDIWYKNTLDIKYSSEDARAELIKLFYLTTEEVEFDDLCDENYLDYTDEHIDFGDRFNRFYHDTYIYEIEELDCVFQIRDSEAGNVIEEVATEEEAKQIVMEYEKEDKEEGNYTPYFYEIVCVDENGDVVEL